MAHLWMIHDDLPIKNGDFPWIRKKSRPRQRQQTPFQLLVRRPLPWWRGQLIKSNSSIIDQQYYQSHSHIFDRYNWYNILKYLKPHRNNLAKSPWSPQNHQPTGVAGTAFVPCVAPAFPPVSPLVCRSMMPMKNEANSSNKDILGFAKDSHPKYSQHDFPSSRFPIGNINK